MCAARDRFDRMLADKDEKARGENPPANRHDSGDGRKTLMVHKGKVTPPPK